MVGNDPKTFKTLPDYRTVRPDIKSEFLIIDRLSEGMKTKTFQRVLARFAKGASLVNLAHKFYITSLPRP